MESYLREKKEAILEDRKNWADQQPLRVILATGNGQNENNDDHKSCLQ